MGLIREVDYKRVQSAAMLASAEVFEGMRESDCVFEVSALGSGLNNCRLQCTCWLNLSTRLPKLSSSSILGTPLSSEAHLGVDGNDIVAYCYQHAQLPL